MYCQLHLVSEGVPLRSTAGPQDTGTDCDTAQTPLDSSEVNGLKSNEASMGTIAFLWMSDYPIQYVPVPLG